MPDNWIPLMAVQNLAGGKVILRLRRGAVVQPEGSAKIHPAQSRTLNTGTPLLLYDEEVLCEGVQVTRLRRFARWIDGSSWTWTALRMQIGRVEGSSNLQFDQIVGQHSHDWSPATAWRSHSSLTVDYSEGRLPTLEPGCQQAHEHSGTELRLLEVHNGIRAKADPHR